MYTPKIYMTLRWRDRKNAKGTGVQFTWPKYLPENLPGNLNEKTSHQKVTIKKSNWTFGKILGKILGKIFWPCELNPRACLNLVCERKTRIMTVDRITTTMSAPSSG